MMSELINVVDDAAKDTKLDSTNALLPGAAEVCSTYKSPDRMLAEKLGYVFESVGV